MGNSSGTVADKQTSPRMEPVRRLPNLLTVPSEFRDGPIKASTSRDSHLGLPRVRPKQEQRGKSEISKKWGSHMGFDKMQESEAPLLVLQTRYSVKGMSNLTPWSARDLIQQKMNHQCRLAKESLLQSAPVWRHHIQHRTSHIPVEEVFAHFAHELHGSRGLSKDTFIGIFTSLLATRNIIDPLMPTFSDKRHKAIGSFFDSLDDEKSGWISIETLATGLVLSYQGVEMQHKTFQASFELVDQDVRRPSSGSLRLKDYLLPLVKAMTPPEGLPLVDFLVEHCAKLIMDAVELNVNEQNVYQLAWKLENKVLSQMEFSSFVAKYNMIDFLAVAIEAKVYNWWLELQTNKQNKQPVQENL